MQRRYNQSRDRKYSLEGRLGVSLKSVAARLCFADGAATLRLQPGFNTSFTAGLQHFVYSRVATLLNLLFLKCIYVTHNSQNSLLVS